MIFKGDSSRVSLGRNAAWALIAALVATPSFAATDIQVWLTMTPYNYKAFEALVKDHNRSQSEVQVKLRNFDQPEALEAALADAVRTKTLPALVELGDTHTLDEVVQRAYITPLYTLLNTPELKRTKWFVSPDNAFIHDAKGRLMALPYMLEIPVMYYNVDAFKKAGLVPEVPQRSWIGLQGQLVSLANNGSRQCPLTSDLPVSINLENLAAVNNQLFASQDNGLKVKGKTLPVFSFDSTFVRHLSMMISWVRSEIMVKPEFGLRSTERFAAGECAVMMSNSGHIGEFNAKRGLHYGVSGLPFYPEVTATPGNPFLSGSGLWATKAENKDQSAATVKFLTWLTQPEQASRWYQQTGFLPATQAAFDATPASFYEGRGQWRELVAVYAHAGRATAQGFRIHNYSNIRAKFHQILQSALDGKQPAVTALQTAAAEANKLVTQR
ncbi:extracellular solute-binding protein [Alcaligenaceae bacterium CGII-47]|nr:extracellular solute-binding protein [Alcaligenaceae bacterium CGII-47]